MVIAVVATAVVTLFTNGTQNFAHSMAADLAFWSGIACLVIFIRLAALNENIYVSDAIRLIPASDTKLYVASFTASFAAFIYFSLVMFVFHVLIALIEGKWSYFWSQLAALNSSIWSSAPLTFTSYILILVAGLLMVWMTISLIHLVMVSIAAFLPAGQQRLIRGILYIVVSIAIIRIVGWLFQLYTQLVINAGLQVNSSVAMLSLLAVVLVVVIESVANIFLMRQFVETTL